MAGYIGSNQPTNLSNTSADIDGTLTADGLVVEDADGATIRIQSSDTSVDGGSLGQLEFYSNDASTGGTGVKGKIQVTDTSSFGTAYEMNFFTGYVTGGAHAETKKMSIGPFGDISFYEDTGTTAKFFWDASAESLTLGGSSEPTVAAGELNLVGPSTTNSTAQASLSFYDGGSNDLASIQSYRGASFSDGELAFEVTQGGSAPVEAMRIDSSGNVGIGTSSPSAKTEIAGSSNSTYLIAGGDDGSNGRALTFTSSASAAFNGAVHTINAPSSQGVIALSTYSTERMRIDSSGNLLVGTTSASGSGDGIVLGANDQVIATRNGAAPLWLNRRSSDGAIALFNKDGTTVGSIGTLSGYIYIGQNDVALSFRPTLDAVLPFSIDANGNRDNAIDLGYSSVRFDDVYATNGTIQTSDQNEKQQIASLTDAEITAAKAISKLFKTFKWNDSVAEKGDAARTHTGVIAQEVEQAMTDAGLNAGDYAFFISSTWWETQTEVPAVEAVEAQDAVYEDVIIPAVEEVLDEEGNVVTEAQPERTEQRLVSEAVEAVEGKEAYTRTDTYETAEEAPEGATERNRKGIRYPQLLSFIGAATEQRLASIESRLDALESA